MGNEDLVNTLLQQNNLLIERLARIETKLELIVEEHAPCRNRISALEAATAELSNSIKSAHHRMTGLEDDLKLLDEELKQSKQDNTKILWQIGSFLVSVGTLLCGLITWALSR